MKVSTVKQKTAAKTDDLNAQMLAFCKVYVSQDKDLFGNGTQSYLEAYGNKDVNGKGVSYLAAMAAASRLLRNVKIIKKINELLEEGGFNNENVDKQHLFLINQHADLKTKLGAIREYNALKKRVDSKPQFNIILPTEEEREKAAQAINKFLQPNDDPGDSTIK